MKRKVVVTGYGVLSALGDTPEKFFGALCEGQNPAVEPTLFETGQTEAKHAAEIQGFQAVDYLGDVNYRPLNRPALFSVVASGRALEHAKLYAEDCAAIDVGLVLGTMFCSVGTITEFDRNTLKVGPKYAKPMMFANTVINAAAGQTALWHNLRGPNSTISSGQISGLSALGYATDLIAQGRTDVLVAGGVEELCFESFYGFDRAGLLAPSGDGKPQAIPFDERRKGFLQAEGAAFLVLEDADAARKRRANIIAEVAGHASGFDISRGQDPQKAGAALVRTMKNALIDAQLSPEEVGCVMASANGLERDKVEAEALAEVFPMPHVPVSAPKACFGEALGAAGPKAAIALLETFRSGILPGVAGYGHADPGFPLRSVSAMNRNINARVGLLNGTAYDGSCCSVILKKHEESPQ